MLKVEYTISSYVEMGIRVSTMELPERCLSRKAGIVRCCLNT